MIYFPEHLTIKWIQEAYEQNRLTPEVLAEEIIKRAEKHKEKNIWIVEPSMELMGKYIKQLPGEKDGYPLWGIPFSIKDNMDLSGVPTSAGCPSYAYFPKRNAYVVQKLIDAGAIPVGKTNMDQFATGLVGTRSPYGEVHNAYQDELISGGSSSGAAVSVAAGMAAFALATDTGGSGRVPAALNSLIGYKTPVGSWSTNGVVPACASIDCVTVFANELEDIRCVDRIARGVDCDCIWSKKIIPKQNSCPDKIYIPEEELYFYGEFEPIYREKWSRALKKVKQIGISVEKVETSCFQKASEILFEGAYVAERWESLKTFIENHEDEIFPVTGTVLRSGAKPENTAEKLFRDLHSLQNYRHQVKQLLKNNIIMMPTAGGTFRRDEVRKNPFETNRRMGTYTNHANLLNLAGIALPENRLDHEYPFGITFYGLEDSENMLHYVADLFLKQVEG